MKNSLLKYVKDITNDFISSHFTLIYILSGMGIGTLLIIVTFIILELFEK